MIDKNKVKYYGIYRGIVVDNNDPGIDIDEKTKLKPFGRCKVFFEGVNSEAHRKDNGKLLPWAEPVFPIFGGNTSTAVQNMQDNAGDAKLTKNYTNTVVGWSSIPHIGAYVWGFFEDGNIQYPKFFGTTQAGNMFMSEHKNQHVIATDNVKIIIDEQPENENNTTNLVDSANKESTSTAISQAEILTHKKMPTRVNITIIAQQPDEEIEKNEERYQPDVANLVNDNKHKKNAFDHTNKNYCAINLNIVGNVNANITGNIYENHVGDKFITQTGNLYHKITGDIEIEHYGLYFERHYGDRNLFVYEGDDKEYYMQNKIIQVDQQAAETIGDCHLLKVINNDGREVGGNIIDTATMIKLN